MENDAYERLLALLALGDDEAGPLPDSCEIDAAVATVASTLATYSESAGRLTEAILWRQVAHASPTKAESAYPDAAPGPWLPGDIDPAGQDQPENGSRSTDPGSAGYRRCG